MFWAFVTTDVEKFLETVSTGKEQKPEWVQIYRVNNDLITRMEEFASPKVV